MEEQNIVGIRTNEWKNKAAEDLTHVSLLCDLFLPTAQLCVKHHLQSYNRLRSRYVHNSCLPLFIIIYVSFGNA